MNQTISGRHSYCPLHEYSLEFCDSDCKQARAELRTISQRLSWYWYQRSRGVGYDSAEHRRCLYCHTLFRPNRHVQKYCCSHCQRCASSNREYLRRRNRARQRAA